ncbi:MAG: hypothetical protein ACJAQ9_000031 [Ilumatobacter sp.]|jgi:hypothetical protein
MATITVLAPNYEADREADIALATRVIPTDPITITVINNGKPNAEQLLGYIAEGLCDRFPVAEVILHSKSSAGKPIDADEAEMLAARSHMVISGLGD